MPTPRSHSIEEKELVEYLERKACDVRQNLLQFLCRVERAHVGGALSLCDVATALFFHFMNWAPDDYKNPDRDRFVLSKGHCSDLLYIIYSELGIFSLEEICAEYNVPSGRFGTHASRKSLPMIEASTGSLGHGLSIAAGFALAAKMDRKHHKIYCVIGDGELAEGSNWEAMMFAAHHNLDNLVLIVDANQYSASNQTSVILDMHPLLEKFLAFGFSAIEIHGNCMQDVVKTFCNIQSQTSRKPVAVISNTLKGKGFAPAEASPASWHTGHIEKNQVESARVLLK